MEYNIYCDESCHLEHDNIIIMELGAIWCANMNMKSGKRRKNIKIG